MFLHPQRQMAGEGVSLLLEQACKLKVSKGREEGESLFSYVVMTLTE